MSECLECGTSEDIHDHHTSYEPEETVPLCASCHRKVHADETHDLYPDQEYVEYVDHDKNIRVTEDTKERLKARGDMGDTYDDVIQDLLDATNDV